MIINEINYKIEQCNQRNAFFNSYDIQNGGNSKRINEELNAEGLWYTYEYQFHYSGSRKKLQNFIEENTNQTLYGINTKMENWEYEEYQKFILEREPQYSEFMGNNN